MSRFKDAPEEKRCKWNRRLSDGSGAQCGRRHVDGEFCSQHAQMATDSPDLSDPVVMRAARMVVSSFHQADAAHDDLKDGVFEISQMQAKDIFRVLVRFMRKVDGYAHG